jgi:hypothetical protein
VAVVQYYVVWWEGKKGPLKIWTKILAETLASLLLGIDCLGITLPLQIEVHLPNKQRAMGKLQHYSLDYNIAVVNVQNSLDLKAAYINHQIQFESHCNVIAVGRLFKSGKFIATCGRLTDEPSKLDCKELSTSNCKISKVQVFLTLRHGRNTYVH